MRTQFVEPQLTCYSVSAKAVRKNVPPSEFYDRLIADRFGNDGRHMRRHEKWLGGAPLLLTEQAWYRAGCPYYKVYPAIIPMLTETSTDSRQETY